MNRNRMEELQLPEGLRTLIRRLRRGGIILHSLAFIFLACACLVVIFHWGISWAVTAFIMSLVCRLAVLLLVGRRYMSAWKVAENPKIVYWGHAIDAQGRTVDAPVTESKNLRLHLRDGTQLEVESVVGTGTSQAQLQDVISWLVQHNPSMRWGDYDQPIAPPDVGQIKSASRQ